MDAEILRVDYDQYQTGLSRKYRMRDNYVSPDQCIERSELPGVIIEVHVQGGDEVETGTPLYTLDAMKMHNVFKARRPGVVKQVNIQPGDRIVKHHPVLEYK